MIKTRASFGAFTTLLGVGFLCFVAVSLFDGSASTAGQGSQDPSNGKPPPGSGAHAGPRTPATQPALDGAAVNIQGISGSDPQFTGVSIDNATNSVNIYRVGGTEGMLSDLHGAYRAAVPSPIGISYYSARLTQSQVSQINAVTESLLPEFEAAGIRLNWWGQGSLDGGFTIWYSGPDAIPASFTDRYASFGADNVVFRQGGEVSWH